MMFFQVKHDTTVKAIANLQIRFAYAYGQELCDAILKAVEAPVKVFRVTNSTGYLDYYILAYLCDDSTPETITVNYANKERQISLPKCTPTFKDGSYQVWFKSANEKDKNLDIFVGNVFNPWLIAYETVNGTINFREFMFDEVTHATL